MRKAAESGLPLNIKPQPMKNNYLKMPRKKSVGVFDIIIDELKLISYFLLYFTQKSITLLKYNLYYK
jgi:hypothetical protein